MSATTQRDELALDIFLADNSNIPEGELRQDWADAPDYHRPYAQNIAAGLIAKGYSKPRTITVDAAGREQLVDTLLAYRGTPRDQLFEYPHRADDSRDMIRQADATVTALLKVLNSRPEAGATR